ncbi:MAG: hypothetical protein HY332_24345 [Chloroflexi bacterium]|nr:hypothetical protein [Chloroflexota bacterium]
MPEAAWRLRKAGSLVKLLALAPGHRLHREQVLDWLWPDADPRAATNSLHRTLHAARHVLEPSLLSGAPSRYLHLQGDVLALSPAAPLWIDVEAFEAAAAAARQTREPAAYEAALDLYAGELLPQDRYEDWAAPRRDELHQLYLALLLELAQQHEVQGDPARAIGTLERAVAGEAAHAGLMRLYALTGRRLAIELAAARLRLLAVEQLAIRLDDALGLLKAERWAGPPRHQALRATLDWSHALLSGPERTLFRRLAVFAGGWTLEAAEAVCGDDEGRTTNDGGQRPSSSVIRPSWTCWRGSSTRRWSSSRTSPAERCATGCWR